MKKWVKLDQGKFLRQLEALKILYGHNTSIYSRSLNGEAVLKDLDHSERDSKHDLEENGQKPE